MNKGEIVELVIRRNNLSISELSRRLHVSRRSVYNWFEQKDLSIDIICKVGDVLDYDFTSDFPDMFTKKKSRIVSQMDHSFNLEPQQNSVNYWRDKYISLLEKHMQMSDHSVAS